MRPVLLCVFVVALLAGPARADLNLTTAGANGTINGAFFTTTDLQPTGTGVIDPFLTIGSQGNQDSEAGYNTDGSIGGQPPLDDFRQKAAWTHSLLVSAIPTFTANGTTYWVFLLDADQEGQEGSDKNRISLNELQVFVGPGLNNFTGTAFSSSPTNPAVEGRLVVDSLTPVYDLDSATVNNRINLAASMGSFGSGSGDMFAYIPVAPSLPGDYLLLYSQFGNPDGSYVSNDGFEEWAVRVPVPGALLLGLFGLGVAGVKLRRFV